ncbi:MAG: guanylate kinase [SAR202 cluster bacterium]|nr:guanylate kinase [SAR202 cluster bacterium]
MDSRGAQRSSPGLLFVLSGPSGVGKDVLLDRMKASDFPYHFTVTTTTRPMRENEIDGRDYHFVTPDRFKQMIDGDELLEWAEVYGNYYGVPKAQVVDALGQGRDVVIKIDVQGAATIREKAPGGVFIFLEAPNLQELADRLTARMTESSEALRTRIETAAQEMDQAPSFDYRVVNHSGRLGEAVAEVERIISAERARPHGDIFAEGS